jgi:hypothetical protein
MRRNKPITKLFTAAIICAAVAAGLAILVLVLLRDAHARPARAGTAGSKEAV